MRLSRKLIGWSAAGAALLILVVLVRRPDEVTVEVAPVVRGALVSTVEGEARTRVRERYVVTAPVAGEVARFVVRVGDSVRVGDPLARIAPLAVDAAGGAMLRAEVAEAEAALEAATARAGEVRLASELASKAVARARALEREGAIAPAQLEPLERDARVAADAVRGAMESLDAARSRRRAARLALAGALRADAPAVTVRSPSTGRVLRIADESQRVVQAGTSLLEIGDPCALEVVVDVLSTDAVRVSPGADVTLTGWGGDGELHGRVVRVEPSAMTRVSALGVDEQRVNVIVTVRDAPAMLGDGFRLDASITVARRERTLLVPVAALFREGEGWGAFVVRGGEVRQVALQLSARNATAASVERGVVAGDTVVLFPSDLLHDGARVRRRE